MGRTLGDSRWFDFGRCRLRQSGVNELIHIPWRGHGGSIHCFAQGPCSQVDDEFAGLLDIANAVLQAAGAVVAGGGEHHLRWIVGDGVEEGVRRQVVDAGRTARRYPADGSRHDKGVKGIGRQAVGLTGA